MNIENPKTFYPLPTVLMPDEKYFICYRHGEREYVTQSERTPERAHHIVEVLNEHETNNARKAKYYWRVRKPGETNEVCRNRSERDTRVDPEGYAVYR